MYVCIKSLCSTENIHSCYTHRVFIEIDQDFPFIWWWTQRHCHKATRPQEEPFQRNLLDCRLHSMWASRYVHTSTHVSFHFNEWWKYHPHSTCEVTNDWAITYQRYTICKSWHWECDHKGLPCSQVQQLFSSNELCLLRSQRFNESFMEKHVLS